MHIVFVNRLSGYGGIAVHNRTISKKLAQLGHQVSLVTARTLQQEPIKVEEDGVIIYTIPIQNNYYLSKIPLFGRYVRSITLWNYSYRVAHLLTRISKENPIDIVEFNDVDGEGFAYLRLKKRALVVIRCQTPNFVLREYYDPSERPYEIGITILMEKYTIRHADVLTAPSNDMAQTIASKCGINVERMTVIPNALDIKKFALSYPLSNGDEQENITILHVGRMERIKGIELLIRAAPAVLKQYPRARFVCIGGGPAGYEDKLLRLIRASGIKDDQFQLLGKVEQDDLVEWYQKADIVVVPTLNYESFSYTVAQGMACGLPVVASRIGGIPETVGSEDTAILVEPGNEGGLIEALITLCRDSNRRQTMGKAARRQAESYFSDGVVAQKMASFYRTIVDK